jgi:hypothetical protein
MLSHIVIFKWIAGTTPEQVESLGRAFDQLAVDFSDTAAITHGPDLRIRDHNGDYALIGVFADRAAWDAYQVDLRHKAVVRDFVTPIQASRLTVQF